MSIYLGENLLTGTGANKSLSNLNSTGKNIANWSNNVTSCITEIPQDIKLELNNGTLTLKAGSKVYVPNGVDIFDVVTVESDDSMTCTTDGTYLVFYPQNTGWLDIISIEYCSSGTTAPGVIYRMWYDTTNNKIKWYQSSSSIPDRDNVSFPVAQITVSGGSITSIDQVFNGFGYIGSTVFALPGVKGLIPNGRNADGTLKNTEFTVGSVLTEQLHDTADVACYLHYNSQNTLELFTWTGFLNQYVYELPSNPLTYGRYYNINDNLWYYYDGSNWYKGNPEQLCYLGKGFISSNKYSGIELRTAFHALDWNDSSTISGWSMPSGNIANLTIGANGATYIAPANGYFQVGGHSNAAWGFIQLVGAGIDFTFQGATAGTWGRGFIPVKKGVSATLYYNEFNFEHFRFVYAEGES